MTDTLSPSERMEANAICVAAAAIPAVVLPRCAVRDCTDAPTLHDTTTDTRWCKKHEATCKAQIHLNAALSGIGLRSVGAA